MGWEVVRIRESEYEFDPERELAPLWERLDRRGIRPGDGSNIGVPAGEWVPVDIADDPAQETAVGVR
jgi:hypothetical protein